MTEYIQHNKWQLAALGCLIMVIYLMMGHIIPGFKNTLQIYQNWKEHEEKIASVNNWENRLSQLNDQQKDLEDFFSRIYVSLPDDDQMSAIVNQVFKKAEAVNLKINQMRPAEKIELESHIQIPIAITMQGRFHEIGRFVNAIEQSDYLMKVDEIRIHSERDTGAAVTGEMLLKVIILNKNANESQRADA